MKQSRRRFLGVGAVTLGGALAGCLGSGSGENSSGENRLALPTLDVAGSPGVEVVVKPPGEVALLDFFATWCAPCKPQMKHLREIHASFPDVHLLSITSERDETAIESFWREYEGTWPVAQDTDLTATSKYSAGQMPTMLVLDGDGTEVWRHVGLAAAESIAEQLKEAGASRS